MQRHENSWHVGTHGWIIETALYILYNQDFYFYNIKLSLYFRRISNGDIEIFRVNYPTFITSSLHNYTEHVSGIRFCFFIFILKVPPVAYVAKLSQNKNTKTNDYIKKTGTICANERNFVPFGLNIFFLVLCALHVYCWWVYINSVHV